MDPPVSEDEDDMYSSTASMTVEERFHDSKSALPSSSNEQVTESAHLLQSSSPVHSRAVTPLSPAKSSPAPQERRSLSVENEKINDEDIPVKIPLSTSLMMSRLDHNTNDIIQKLSEPKIEKITIKFQPIGSIEQIQPKIFKISSSQQFQTLVKFLNKKLSKKIVNKNTNKLFGGYIFCYLHNSFTPGPEEIIGNLFEVSIL